MMRAGLRFPIATTADISEVAYDKLDSDFKDAFGITGVQYPDGYQSSNTDVLTVKDYTVTAVKPGKVTVKGIAGDNHNAKINIAQNALNMTDATSGFKDAGTDLVSGSVSLPVIVSGNADFTKFSIKISDKKSYSGTINKDDSTIKVTVPKGTDVKKLIAEFETADTSATVSVQTTTQESGKTVNDFTNQVDYKVETPDGTVKYYEVTVTEAAASSSGFKSYSLKDKNGNTYDGTIDKDKHTIAVTVPKDTNVKTLIAKFETADTSDTVLVGTTTQESGKTVNDFTNTVTYKVTSKEGSTQIYRVIVTAQLPDNAISIKLGTASYHTDDSSYHFDDATVDGKGIKTIFINFSNNVTKGEAINLPASEGSFSNFTVSATSNDYAKRINIHDGATAAAVQEYLWAVNFHMSSVKTIKMVVTSDDIDCDTFYNIDTQHYYFFP